MIVTVYSPSAVIRAGLASLLESASEVKIVRVATSPVEAESMIADGHSDVLVMDVVGEGMDSLPWNPASVPLVLLTESGNREALAEVLRLGAGAVVARDSLGTEITAAVRAAGSGFAVLDPRLARSLSGAVPALLRTTVVQGEELTPRETEVLGMMAEGLGNKVIARQLEISEHTVKFHVSSVMAKLAATSRTEAVMKGMRAGLITI